MTTAMGRYLTSIMHHGTTRDASVNRLASPALKYPTAMAVAYREGTVRVTCMVDVQGHSHGCHITGGANALFNSTALDFATHALYHPALRNGVPVAVTYTMRVNFVMRRGR